MIILDFIYFSIYSIVPDKAILGKRDVACTLFATFSSLVLFGGFPLTGVVEKNAEKKLLLTIALIILLSLFILTRKIFLRVSKFRNMHRRFRNIPKWVLKIVGIFYLFLCLCLTFALATIVKNYY